jgi:hypothetical protein
MSDVHRREQNDHRQSNVEQLEKVQREVRYRNDHQKNDRNDRDGNKNI